MAAQKKLRISWLTIIFFLLLLLFYAKLSECYRDSHPPPELQTESPTLIARFMREIGGQHFLSKRCQPKTYQVEWIKFSHIIGTEYIRLESTVQIGKQVHHIKEDPGVTYLAWNIDVHVSHSCTIPRTGYYARIQSFRFYLSQYVTPGKWVVLKPL